VGVRLRSQRGPQRIAEEMRNHAVAVVSRCRRSLEDIQTDSASSAEFVKYWGSYGQSTLDISDDTACNWRDCAARCLWHVVNASNYDGPNDGWYEMVWCIGRQLGHRTSRLCCGYRYRLSNHKTQVRTLRTTSLRNYKKRK
jgi:hypothetical protein